MNYLQILTLTTLLVTSTTICSSTSIGVFHCHEGSKYINAEDCRTYLLCLSGQMKVQYCPSGFFNPFTDDCDISYKCFPDSLGETTTIVPNAFTSLNTVEIITTDLIIEASSSSEPNWTEDFTTTSDRFSTTIETITEEDFGSGDFGTTTDSQKEEIEITETPEILETTLITDMTDEVSEVFSSTVAEMTTTHDLDTTPWSTIPPTITITTESPVIEIESTTKTTRRPRTTTTTTEESTTTIPITTTTESTTTTTTTTTTTPTTTTQEITTESSMEDLGNPCPRPDTAHLTFVPDAKNCEKYHLCYYSQPIELSCISGLHWNQEKQMCDYPANAKCVAEADASPFPKCSAPGLYTIAHPDKCEYFIMCMNGEQTIQQCDSFHSWDVLEEKCVMKERATCILDITRPGQAHA